MTLELGLLAVLVATVYFFVAGALSFSAASRYRGIYFHESTRRYWANAREALFRLVHQGKIDPRSETFRAFNGMTTFFLRRPDDYESISRVLVSDAIPTEHFKAPIWYDDVADWPIEMKEVVAPMVVGFGRVAMSPSRLRWAQWGLRAASIIAKYVGYRTRRTLGGFFLRFPAVRATRDLLLAEKGFKKFERKLAAASVHRS